MTNNCQLISQNGETEDPGQVCCSLFVHLYAMWLRIILQMCNGGYYGGASVYCSGGK